jgi:hypothetical protein
MLDVIGSGDEVDDRVQAIRRQIEHEPVCTSPPIRKSPPPAQSAPVEPSPEPALLAPRSYWAISIQPLCCPFPWAWKGATVGRRQGRPGGIIDVACGDGHAPEKPGKAGRAFWPSLSPCQPRPLNPAAHAARPQCSRIEASSQLSARRKYEVCLCSRSCAGVITRSSWPCPNGRKSTAHDGPLEKDFREQALTHPNSLQMD